MTILWAEHALLPGGWAENVRVELGANGRIAKVEAGATPGGERVDLLLPAMANLHSHAFQRAMAGLSEARGPQPRDTFWTWRQIMYRFLDHLTPQDVEAIAALVQMEMLEAGYATNVEFHYLHHRPGGVPYDNIAEMSERIAAAAARTGIGLTLLPVHLSVRRRATAARSARASTRFGTTPDAFAALLDAAEAALRHLPADAGIGVAPHSLRAVSPEALALCANLRPGRPLHMHLAEQLPEIEEVAGRIRPPSRRVAAGQTQPRSPLDTDPPDPHDRGRNTAPGSHRRGRRPVPDHGIEPRRRHLQWRGLEGCTRAVRLRLGQQYPYLAGRGIAHTGIQPAPARHRARHSGRAGTLHRPGSLRDRA